MNLFYLFKNKFIKKKINLTPEFEISTWRKEQVMLGKLSGIDTTVYDYPDLSPILMKIARENLECGAAPSVISKVVTSYLNKDINEEQFEELCSNSIYVIDMGYLQKRFQVIGSPDEEKKSFNYPAAFYGSLFGDIAGSAYEFGFTIEQRKNLNYHTCIQTGSCPTDDTILSCATAACLKERIIVQKRNLELNDYNKHSNYPFEENPFAQKYKDYARMPFVGASYGGAFYSWVYSDFLTPYGSFGNGSAMRISPIPDYFSCLDDVILYSIASAAATHNHYEGIAGAVITATSTWMAKNGYSKEQIFRYITKFYVPNHTDLYISHGVALKDFTMEELKHSVGPTVCPFSVPAAAICFYYADSYEGVIDNVLSFDGDSDTIGAIAGSIAGAYFGVPEYARDIVNQKKPNGIFDEALNFFTDHEH